MEVYILKLEFLDDLDVDFGIVKDLNLWDIELEDDDFDFEFYSVQFVEGLENFEEDWG